MSEEGTAQIINLEYWMGNLPEQLKDIPIIYLAIPGSHDSMTYGINSSSGLAPDAEPILHRLYPLFRGTIRRWTITQALDTMQQLLIGIRYLDLRLATKPGTNGFFFTHGLYANEISEALEQVKEFVDTHPEEVVILDFQHFYGFTPADHQRLMSYLLNMYGGRIAARQDDLREITINSLSRLKQQVIIVYRHQSVYATNEFWRPQMLPSPWPNKERVPLLLNFLEAVKRHPGMGFVHQAVLTPTPSFIVFRILKLALLAGDKIYLTDSTCPCRSVARNLCKHDALYLRGSDSDRFASSLRNKCAVPVKNEVLPKLRDFSPGPPLASPSLRAPVNVVIADFVDLDDAIFPRTIIELNSKLLRNTDVVYHNYG